MDILYKKIDNRDLFSSFNDKNLLNLIQVQNYIPLYNKFFNVNESNFNSINLNQRYNLELLKEKENENKYSCKLFDDIEKKKIDSKCFLKLSPLLDPFKYMAGRYELDENLLFTLPKLGINNCHKKMLDENNSAYVDSFFTYLTSQLLNRYNFLHGLDFYGSFLGIKNNYHVDICDDLDSLTSNKFFNDNLNIYYKFVNSNYENLLNNESRKNKKKIEILDVCNEETDFEVISLDDVNDNTIDISDGIFELENINLTTNKNNTNNKSNSSSSTLSSRSSNTQKSCDENDVENQSGNNSDSNSSSEENSSETTSEISDIIVSVNKFPIQVICLESCEDTLDSLFLENNLSNDELTCIVVQILMMLITYQKVFSLTHNDLHTNNIMYVKTDKIYLYYKLDGKHYKVKTYGKIFKIIDFGRAIYKYKKQLICSDSYDKEGDANTQYNCEPYFDDRKARLEPNFSFDLCRLGCSIYDYVADKVDNIKDVKNPIYKIILGWCLDDDGRDILYKSNDEERYPGFKLYKMIARKVNNHKPIDEIRNKYFDKLVVSKKNIKKGSFIWNLDDLEHF
jgi:hypothetical protein